MTSAHWRAAALILTISALAAAPAFAMPGTKTVRTSDPAERFAQMDTSGDAKLVWEEFRTARPNLNENAFKMIDADHDGGISLDEWKAFSSGHGGAAKGPDMGAMMKAMGGSGKVTGMNAVPTDDIEKAPAAPSKAPAGMPLIMPPVQNQAAPASPAGMPLIMPPKSSN
ncbi:MAG: hypothetical protein IJB29_03310 [Mailhella sp.]|nr:hypothetical protein [Mailhella sp.]